MQSVKYKPIHSSRYLGSNIASMKLTHRTLMVSLCHMVGLLQISTWIAYWYLMTDSGCFGSGGRLDRVSRIGTRPSVISLKYFNLPSTTKGRSASVVGLVKTRGRRPVQGKTRRLDGCFYLYTCMPLNR